MRQCTPASAIDNTGSESTLAGLRAFGLLLDCAYFVTFLGKQLGCKRRKELIWRETMRWFVVLLAMFCSCLGAPGVSVVSAQDRVRIDVQCSEDPELLCACMCQTGTSGNPPTPDYIPNNSGSYLWIFRSVTDPAQCRALNTSPCATNGGKGALTLCDMSWYC